MADSDKNDGAAEEFNLIDQIVSEAANETPNNFRGPPAASTPALEGDSRSVSSALASLDAAISRQLAVIMHAPAFQKLEASWRGLRYLVFETETSSTLQLRVLNASKRDLTKDLESADDAFQSQLFSKVYENPFGSADETPFGALIGDYEFSNDPNDMDLLTGISVVAAEAQCPFIAAPSPQLFGCKNFDELANARNMSHMFESPASIKWRALRGSEESRFVAMALPRVLARLPYGATTNPVESFPFDEIRTATNGKSAVGDHGHFCWMNAAYVYGAVLTRAFGKSQWFTAIQGKENGGAVENLPTCVFRGGSGATTVRSPLDGDVTTGGSGARQEEFNKLGFLPMALPTPSDYATFFGSQTVQKPKVFDKPGATLSAAQAIRLPAVLATSRIAHFLKLIARERVGSMNRSMLQELCSRWIAQWVCKDQNPSTELKSQFPFAQAMIEVKDSPGNPGYFVARVVVQLWPVGEETAAPVTSYVVLP